MVDKMIANLEEKTGKKLEEWIQLVQNSGIEKHMARIKFLKTEHALTHGYANLIVHKAKEVHSGPSSSELLLQQQYESKAELKLIYDKLVEELVKLGKDIELAPKKAYVSLRRKKQFGLIQPSTKQRIDIGIQLKSKDATQRLEISGSFNGMVSHRVRITDIQQIDKELIAWLKEAYERAG